jgi:RpiR family carbohydrate utilization transcriptional regulator
MLHSPFVRFFQVCYFKNMARRGKQNDRDGRPPASDLEQRFLSVQTRLGPQRQKLIRSILDHSEETCFLSSRELAKRYDVDAATVVRAVQALGYKGFADFALDLRHHFISRITPYTVLKAATQEKRSVQDHIDHTLNKSLENLNDLRANLSRDQVIALARLIHGSRNILVVGLDLAASIAYHLAYSLTVLGFHAEAATGSEGTVQHKVKLLTGKDLLIAISFGQCLRVTVEAAQRATKMGVATFGITDSETTPIARYCENFLIAPTISPSFLSSYAAPMALINAIYVACVHLHPKRSLTKLKPTDKEYLAGLRWYRESKVQ